jgi:hypothetical protein
MAKHNRLSVKPGGNTGRPGLEMTRDKTTKKKKCKAMVCIARSAMQPGR